MKTIVRLNPLIAMVGVIALAVGILESGAFHKGVEEAGCQACHIMHGSNVREGIMLTLEERQPKLIAVQGDGCLACHADEGTGPNVLGNAAAELPGGYYDNVNIDPSYGHNPSDGAESIMPDDFLGREPPGGGGIVLDNWSCNSCHDTLGGFEFRLLRKDPGNLDNEVSDFIATNEDESDIWDGGSNVEQYEGNHNVYRTAQFDTESGFGRWCAACHSDFHAIDPKELLHPTARPLREEYIEVYGGIHSYEYPLETTNSNATTDVEWDLIYGEEGVTCLSCHKAHASENPSALRWYYSPGEPGDPGVGCGKCHTEF
jgi:hypothetical protein